MGLQYKLNTSLFVICAPCFQMNYNQGKTGIQAPSTGINHSLMHFFSSFTIIIKLLYFP